MHLQHHISTLKSRDERYLMKWCIRKDGFKLTLFSMCYFYYNMWLNVRHGALKAIHFFLTWLLVPFVQRGKTPRCCCAAVWETFVRRARSLNLLLESVGPKQTFLPRSPAFCARLTYATVAARVCVCMCESACVFWWVAGGGCCFVCPYL